MAPRSSKQEAWGPVEALGLAARSLPLEAVGKTLSDPSSRALYYELSNFI